MNFEVKAQKIISDLDPKMRDTLDKVCEQLSLSPVEYVTRQLHAIEARKQYCQKEGMDYAMYRETNFTTQLKNIRSGLQNLISKFYRSKSKK
ncbi:MAG: hypothetical protein ACOY3I_03875 [Verrucomicrobiota bacterium]